MLNRLRSRAKGQEGFTLIELLVVVLIIGILAAIAIPQFIGQKDKANASAVTALLRDGSVAMESYYTDTQTYPATAAAAATALAGINPSISWVTSATGAKNEVVVTASSATAYTLEASSGPKTYEYDRAANGTVTRTITAGGSGTW